MKKNLTIHVCCIILTILQCISTANADTVNVEVPGTLSALLSSSAKEATISGPINGTDVKYLRQLIIEKNLTILDLSEVRFVSGGEAYYEDFEVKEDDVIGEQMFYECKQLTSVILPKTITKILARAFSKSGLKEVEIPSNIRRLGFDSFAYCEHLENVIIGKNVSNFEQGVFWGSNVKEAFVKPINTPAISAYLFSSNPIIHVYQVALSDYKGSEWTQHGTIKGDLEKYYSQEKDPSEIAKESLTIYFNDYACTSLKEEYLSMSDELLTSTMSDGGMPDYMISLALKIKNENWASYEKDFRIHEYKAYSDANYWNNKLSCYGSSYMGNPTGIYAADYGALYVFVDQDIPSDATLYFGGCVDYGEMINSAKYGTKLHKGLNVIDGVKSALYYVIYTADTQSMTRKLTEWPEMKIHIEGGVVNGYYDVNRHNDADYKAILKNATHERFTVKGNHSAFIFKTETFRKEWPNSIDESISWFDSITVWEKEVMGICSSVANGYRAHEPFNIIGGESFYPDYYNNPNWAIQGEEGDAGWANASSYRTSYNGFDCVAASFNVKKDNHDVWCAAHETGHQNQRAINLEGCGEVSNNLFSNIIRFLDGRNMSSGLTLSTTMTDFADNKPYFARDIWSMTRMYYQLYLYYHQAQNNTSFYPELFKALRNDPLEVWGDTNNSMLKFVRKVCQIANEDLTDFFTAWGFFVPCESSVEDYGNYNVIVKQSDIDATLAEISKYPRKNKEILFIEDRIKRLKTTGFFTTAGKDRQEPDQKVGTCGDLGQFTDYISGNNQPSDYSYIQVDSLFVMSGKGGVGFIVLDEDDKLLYASNNKKFSIPSHILKKCYTIYSIDADGTLHQVMMSEEKAVQEVNVKTAGTLSSLLSSGVLKTKISGSLNGTDVKYLRELINEGNLSVLDLSDAMIVSGGMAYYKDCKTSDNQIGDYMFFECGKLVSIKLPKTIAYIGQRAFSGTGLKDVDIPDSVEWLELDAFAYCPELESATVGEGVSRMGQGIFWSSATKNVYIKPMCPPSLSAYIFSSNPTIHVYKSALSAYQASDWAQYGTIVGDLDEIIANDIQQIGQDQQSDESIYNLFGLKIMNNSQGKIFIKEGKKILVH